jgi:hypothetical protein
VEQTVPQQQKKKTSIEVIEKAICKVIALYNITSITLVSLKEQQVSLQLLHLEAIIISNMISAFYDRCIVIISIVVVVVIVSPVTGPVWPRGFQEV